MSRGSTTSGFFFLNLEDSLNRASGARVGAILDTGARRESLESMSSLRAP